jgi:hypothetical protein
MDVSYDKEHVNLHSIGHGPWIVLLLLTSHVAIPIPPYRYHEIVGCLLWLWIELCFCVADPEPELVRVKDLAIRSNNPTPLLASRLTILTVFHLDWPIRLLLLLVLVRLPIIVFLPALILLTSLKSEAEV